MSAILFYYLLLAVWPALVWPALRLRGWARLWLVLAALAGLAATVYEVRLWSGQMPAIRLDILPIAFVLAVLYLSAAAILVRARRRLGALSLALAVAVAGGGLAYRWHLAGREAERLSALVERGHALMFAALFRDAATYERHFGPFAPAAPFPVGHWQGPGDAHWSRLIVNARGGTWLFHRCGETECPFAGAAAALRPVSTAPESWEADLMPRFGAAQTIRVARQSPERLSLTVGERTVPLLGTPAPIDPSPAPAVLEVVGSYAAIACRGQHAAVRQVWLWREADRLYALAVAATPVAGLHAGYVTPLVLGQAERTGEAWRFRFRGSDLYDSATVALAGADAVLTLAGPNRSEEPVALPRGEIFRDEVVDLAPLSGGQDWHAWFRALLVGHFFEADIPAC